MHSNNKSSTLYTYHFEVTNKNSYSYLEWILYGEKSVVEEEEEEEEERERGRWERRRRMHLVLYPINGCESVRVYDKGAYSLEKSYDLNHAGDMTNKAQRYPNSIQY